MDMVTGFLVTCRAVPYATDVHALRITRARGAERGGGEPERTYRGVDVGAQGPLAAPRTKRLSDPKGAGWDS